MSGALRPIYIFFLKDSSKVKKTKEFMRNIKRLKLFCVFQTMGLNFRKKKKKDEKRERLSNLPKITQLV